MKTRRILIPVFGFVAAAVLAVAGGWLAPGNIAEAQTNLTAPTNVRAVQGPGIGQAEVSWDAVAGATGYIVEWVDLDAAWAAYDAGQNWTGLIRSMPAAASEDGRESETIGNLLANPARGYAFRVISRQDGATSDPSAWKTLRLTAIGNAEIAVEILAAGLEIIRQSSALVSADLPTNRIEIGQYERMVNLRNAALQEQLAVLNGSGHTDRAAEIQRLANGLVSNAMAIREGRPALLTAVAKEATERQMLTRTNQTYLLPNAEATLDEDFYNLVTSADGDGSAGSGGVSRDDLLHYWHLDSLSSSLTVGSTFLQVASLMQGPEYVARIRETYDSIAGRMERDIEFLNEEGSPELKSAVLKYAIQAYNAGSGMDNYFDRLEGRLTMVVDERDLVEDNEDALALLRNEIGSLVAEIRGEQLRLPEATPEPDDDNPGVTAAEVKFGQSAALTGPSAALGTQMEIGIRAAFAEANAAGGVHGRTLNLLPTLDDRYEPDAAFANTQRLIEEEQVFGLIGAVGTPTSRAASPLTKAGGVPFVAPFTGAQLLREDGLTNVLNLRASYHQETERMVEYLVGREITRVAVLYQNDSYGVDGLMGVDQELTEQGLETVASWYYRRNTTAVQSAVYRIAAEDPQAVIIIGASAPAARAIEMLREKLGQDTIFMNVSFVGSNALATALGAAGQGVFVTQVVPLPTDTNNPLVAKYHAALSAYDSDAVPGFISLEGYLAGRLAIEGLQRCGQHVTRACFLDAVQTAGTFDLDGFELMFGATDNQGSDAVFLTQIDANGQYSIVP